MSRQRATQEELDARVLMASPAFHRFLLRISQKAGIWIPTFGADTSLQYREGRRSLGLEILGEAAAGLPQRNVGPEHVLALILTESIPQETNDASDPQDESER